jgi:protein-export membrane protein SecD
MNKNALLKMIVVLIIAVLAVWYLYPSFIYYAKSPEERLSYLKENPDIIKKVLNLGLDLQGGMRMVLEIDRSSLDKDAQKDVLDRAFTVIENRINGLGVAEPTIQKQGTDRIIVELPGLRDEAAAKRVIGSTAQLEFNLLREPAELQRAIKVIDDHLAGKTTKDTASIDSTDSTALQLAEEKEKAKRLFEGATEESEDTSGAVEKKDVTSFSEHLVALGSQVGVPDRNKLKVDEILDRRDVREALERAGLGGSMFLWGHEIEKQGNSTFRPLYYVKSRAELRGDIIKDAVAQIAQGGMDAGQWEVNLEMNREGSRKFSRITGANTGKFLAIVLDSTVYSAPQIREKIPYGRAQITGNFTAEDSRGLAIVLRAGALPAPAKIIEKLTVGPSLGQDSIRKGFYASAFALLAIMIFMALYYKISGIYADIALFFNLVLVMAGMAAVNATLTLPGIGALVLNIGMAVDANVLIFERIREELALGKTPRSAIDTGYARAFITIMDSNLTTLLTGIILLWVGSGPVKGFAVTLIFGIIASVFCACYLTRIFQDLTIGSGGKTKISI